jgi:threonine/homoserine/homoserine lactone efflux protein
VGIVVAVVLFVLLASVLPAPSEGSSSPVGAVIKLVLGAGMLLLGIRQWRGRPAAGAEATMPTWMSAIDTMSAGKAFGLGFLLSAVNPKNLLMAMSAGVIIGSAGLPTGQVVTSVLVFTVIAASTVLIPVIGYLSASARLAEPLGHLRTWLVANNAAIMAVLLTVIGAVMVGKGIGSF